MRRNPIRAQDGIPSELVEGATQPSSSYREILKQHGLADSVLRLKPFGRDGLPRNPCALEEGLQAAWIKRGDVVAQASHQKTDQGNRQAFFVSPHQGRPLHEESGASQPPPLSLDCT